MFPRIAGLRRGVHGMQRRNRPGRPPSPAETAARKFAAGCEGADAAGSQTNVESSDAPLPHRPCFSQRAPARPSHRTKPDNGRFFLQVFFGHMIVCRDLADELPYLKHGRYERNLSSGRAARHGNHAALVPVDSPRWAYTVRKRPCIVRSELKLNQNHQPVGRLSSRVRPCPRSESICAKSQVTSRFSVDRSKPLPVLRQPRQTSTETMSLIIRSQSAYDRSVGEPFLQAWKLRLTARINARSESPCSDCAAAVPLCDGSKRMHMPDRSAPGTAATTGHFIVV